ncbi:hypothetical protein AUJ66_07915 [Candidatus Desantisbacteria bacterium CG1_02_38_46]|uniref:Lipoprotein-releasing system transmembrane subunit LolC n=3 Tax=unclassified Candidatus Desantisiibacteriota TaxID=3106372 RepID=A0A2H9PAP5_9BACT|nr:MAG: hypothetical protein AUJ66_07915 [Candidatus Desantisbacteria bacterium CG1_02_38_46]PIU51422.1 MAG: lipoprotein-releasing system transmembrane subunit LolC [Candidatus Desantisbacteria bacterium CG07_land_8_20_14_0_80_39_15]PIZ15544.1 MAG: lipoprotein-releasing system transmembrane subunit LolC [Candidatus Desantisbacteria bacterium CG_4_10_14_0_8_um_filter_39_17]
MKYTWFVVWRHFRKKKGFFVNLSATLSVGGIIVGVTALNITLAVMSGFDADLKDKILGLQPYIFVFNEKSPIKYEETIEKIRASRGVHSLHLTPLINGQGIIRSGNTILGVEIKGIDPNTEGEVTSFPKTVREGKFSLDKGEMLIGKELAKGLGIKLYDKCNLFSGFSPQTKEFKVAGIFDSGFYTFDRGIAYISLKDAGELFGLKTDEVTTIGIKIKDIYQANKIASIIQGTLKYPYVVRSWDQMNRNLFSALKLEKITMFILLGLIILVAGFGIANTMVMSVMQKVREIGIIEALGATPRMVRNIFVFEGAVLGLIGVSIGSALGFFLCKLLQKYQFIKLPSDVYYISSLPVKMQTTDFFSIALLALGIVIICSIYPAIYASKIMPAEAMRQ